MGAKGIRDGDVCLKLDWRETANHTLSNNVVVTPSTNHASLCSLGEERGEGNIKERQLTRCHFKRIPAVSAA